MNLLEKLKNNKGLVSSALGKSLAQDVLKGNLQILNDAFDLISFEDKSVRSASAIIIEEVAKSKPELVVSHLNSLFPALDFSEPQTRWIIIRVYGLFAKLKPDVVRKVLPKAEKFLNEKSSLCLQDAAITYLGYLGAVSEKDAQTVFPYLEKALISVPKRITRIFESFERMVGVLNDALKIKLMNYAEKYSKDKSPSIKSKAVRLKKKLTLVR